MATNIFIKIDQVKGECTDNKHKEWIEVLSWSHGFAQPASPMRASTGSTIEKANHSDLTLTKYLDSASDDLIGACWKGFQYEKADIECFRSDGDNEPIKYLEINMEDVIIGNYSIGVSEGSIPVENVSLAYSKVKYTYIPKNKDKATPEGAQPIWHDLKLNTVG